MHSWCKATTQIQAKHFGLYQNTLTLLKFYFSTGVFKKNKSGVWVLRMSPLQVHTAWHSDLLLCYRMLHTVQNCIPLTELPSLSSGGDQHIIPITLGTTSKIPPATPDLAGRPTYNRENKTSYITGDQLCVSAVSAWQQWRNAENGKSRQRASLHSFSNHLATGFLPALFIYAPTPLTVTLYWNIFEKFNN